MLPSKRTTGWILGLVGLGLVIVGYAISGGTLKGAQDYLRSYTQTGSGWIVLVGLGLLFVGFLLAARRTLLKRSPPKEGESR